MVTKRRTVVRVTPRQTEDRVLATPERGRHDALEYAERLVFSEDGGRGTSKSLGHRVLTQRAIDRLVRTGTISRRQYDAAERLYQHWHAAALDPRVVATLDGNGGGRSPTEAPWMLAGSERVLAHRQALRAALRAAGARLRGVLLAVVCSDEPLEAWMRRERMPANATGKVTARTTLRLALDVVADEFGLPR